MDDDGAGSPADDWPLPGNPDEHVGNRHHLGAVGLPATIRSRRPRHRGGRAYWFPACFRIADTGLRGDFYTFINIQGELDGRLEYMLSQIEGDDARVIKNLTSIFFREPSADDREALCLLLAFQWFITVLTSKLTKQTVAHRLAQH